MLDTAVKCKMLCECLVLLLKKEINRKHQSGNVITETLDSSMTRTIEAVAQLTAFFVNRNMKNLGFPTALTHCVHDVSHCISQCFIPPETHRTSALQSTKVNGQKALLSFLYNNQTDLQSLDYFPSEQNAFLIWIPVKNPGLSSWKLLTYVMSQFQLFACQNLPQMLENRKGCSGLLLGVNCSFSRAPQGSFCGSKQGQLGFPGKTPGLPAPLLRA